METIKGESRFEKYIVYAAILFTPLLVIQNFANPFVTPQLVFMSFALGLVLIIKSVRNIANNKISFSASSLDLPVILLGVSYIISSILQTPNKMEAFFLPGTTTLVIAGVILFFVINQLDEADKRATKYFIFASTVIVSFIVLMSSTGVFKSFSGLPEFIKSSGFSPLGGPLPSLILFVAISPLIFSLLVSQKDMVKKVFLGVAFSIIILAAVLSLFNALPGKDTSPQLAGFRTSWFVAADSLKQSPLLGVGPGNYLTAFNRYRPLSFNATPLWSIRFISAQSFLFTTITETGILGGAAFLLILYSILKNTKEAVKRNSKNILNERNATFMSLGILTIALLLFPSTPALLFTFFALLALSTHTNLLHFNAFKGEHESTQFAARIPVLIAALPIIIGVGLYGYYASKVIAADLTFKSSLDYINRNSGREAYDSLQSAINTNPYVDRYRITYAQINLALANSIAQKEEISEQERETIAQLVQQAIREAKVAVALNPGRAGNWEVLASIYRAIMPLAEGADAYATQTYAQAIALDPLNPNTRIALGGIYYAAKAYENAIDLFKLAVATKPDHANAHYNLAMAYRENGDIDKAISEMSAVISLVDRNSNDFTVASKALEDLQSKKKAEVQDSENLTAPPSGEEPGLTPPLELPEEASPPTPEVSPISTPSPTPEASPTPAPLP